MSRFAAPIAPVLFLFALWATPAHAGSYTVTACQGSAIPNNSFNGAASPNMVSGDGCPLDNLRPNTSGMQNRPLIRPGNGSVPTGAVAAHRFDAPAGTTLGNITFKPALRTPSAASTGWRAGLWGVRGASVGKLWGDCGGLQCNGLGVAGDPVTVAMRGWDSAVFQLGCQAVACVTTAEGNGPPAWLNVGDVSVEVLDDAGPQVAARGTGWSDGWHRGTETVSFDASDASGIRTTYLVVDGALRGSSVRDCDYTRPRPCSDVTGEAFALDTSSLSDGSHPIYAQAYDAAANPNLVGRTIRVDNHAPAQAADLAVTDGEGWRAQNRFNVTWTSPGDQIAPVAAAHFRLCKAALPSACIEGERRATSLASISDLSIPTRGDYTLRLWLEDEAGNVDPNTATPPVHLRFDDEAPGAAAMSRSDAWVGATEAASHPQAITLGAGDIMPVSGIAGYSLTFDGSEPDETPELFGASAALPLRDMPEGATVVKARAVSGSGVAALRSGVATIRIDRSRPDVRVSGAPAPESWSRGPVSLDVTGTDQAALSGVTEVQMRVDGAPAVRRSGAHGLFTVTGDGRHSVALRAVDGAGNDSLEQTVSLRIDKTAPEVSGFSAPDPDNPQLVEVGVLDRTSGLAHGRIELRRAGTSSWTALASSIAGGRLRAQLDDAAWTAGSYAIRAVVTDAAGNQAVADRAADGGIAQIQLPLRIATRLTAIRSTAAAYGRSRSISAVLETSNARPVRGSVVSILSRLRSGGTEKLVARRHTDALGRILYRAPAGASRTLRLSFAGTGVLAPAVASIRVLVPASSTFGATPRTLSNHSRVRLSGRLRGRPFPAGGKLVDLQAFYRGRWRSFATTRTDRSGRFSYAYRFEVTSGTVRYRFRAVLRREFAYPYEFGRSPVTSVVVRG